MKIYQLYTRKQFDISTLKRGGSFLWIFLNYFIFLEPLVVIHFLDHFICFLNLYAICCCSMCTVIFFSNPWKP